MNLKPPKTQFARRGEVQIADQVIGEGPLDLVYVTGWFSHIELAWEELTLAAFLPVRFFFPAHPFRKRGPGLSDRVPNDKLT